MLTITYHEGHSRVYRFRYDAIKWHMPQLFRLNHQILQRTLRKEICRDLRFVSVSRTIYNNFRLHGLRQRDHFAAKLFFRPLLQLRMLANTLYEAPQGLISLEQDIDRRALVKTLYFPK